MDEAGMWERIHLESIGHSGFYDPYLKWWEIGEEILRGEDVSIPIKVTV